MWQNGFSINDDGGLRSYKDPANKSFLASVMTGRIPNELVKEAENGEVHVDIEDHKDFSPKNVIARINDSTWKEFPYSKQNWGNWLHHMGAYVGKMKPAMAHYLILSATKKNQKILDPFCGIGTINTESSFLKRHSFGNDLNPYAYAISAAKSDRRNIQEHIKYIENIKIKTSRIKIDKYSNKNNTRVY